MFPAAVRDDMAEPRHAGGEYEFLQRSGRPDSASARDLIAWWMAEFPRGQRHSVITRMESRNHNQLHQFRGALAELFMHRLLVSSGGEVQASPAFGDQEPDFMVTAGGEKHLVEVTSIAALDLPGNARYVVDVLNDIWRVEGRDERLRLAVRIHCGGGHFPRRSALIQSFKELVNHGKVGDDAHYDNGLWRVWARLVHAGAPGAPVVSAEAVNERGEPRDAACVRRLIRDRIRDKGRRYRHLDLRTVIAVNVCGAGLDTLAAALLGPDGLWSGSGRRPYLLGILGMDGLNPCFTPEIETLYFHNPHAPAPAPAWTSGLSRAGWRGTDMETVPGKSAMELIRGWRDVGRQNTVQTRSVH